MINVEDLEIKTQGINLPGGNSKGGVIKRTDGGSFIADGFISGKNLNYSSRRRGKDIDVNKTILILQVTNTKLLLLGSPLSFDNNRDRNNRNIQAKFV